MKKIILTFTILLYEILNPARYMNEVVLNIERGLTL